MEPQEPKLQAPVLSGTCQQRNKCRPLRFRYRQISLYIYKFLSYDTITYTQSFTVTNNVMCSHLA
jgi:hypothetical protein